MWTLRSEDTWLVGLRSEDTRLVGLRSEDTRLVGHYDLRTRGSWNNSVWGHVGRGTLRSMDTTA